MTKDSGSNESKIPDSFALVCDNNFPPRTTVEKQVAAKLIMISTTRRQKVKLS